jgi:hypothetical protein
MNSYLPMLPTNSNCMDSNFVICGTAVNKLFIVPSDNAGPVISHALAAHQTQILSSFRGTS